MANVRVLKSSINGETSLTNQLINEFLAARRAAGHRDRLTEHDLSAMALPTLDRPLLSDQLIAELKASDLLVIGAPMYNLNVPTDLKKWFDLVARARETFRYTDSWPQGLVEGVRAVVVSSRGGIHQGETTDAITPYLRAVLGLMGFHEVEFIYAEGLDNRPHGRDAGIASARAQIAQLAVPA